MPDLQPFPHPLALFSLVPLNKRTADGIVDHPANRHLVSLVPGARNNLDPGKVALGINIGFQIGSKSKYTLATIGRNGDITVEGSSISRIQCSFEIHEDTEEIFLCDRSSSWSTQTFGPQALVFELERPDRRVVVAPKANKQFGFGGVKYDLFQFQIVWHDLLSNFQEQITNRENNPRFTRTVDVEIPTALPSRRATRIHTPGVREPMIRYYKKTVLGKGQFGEVWRAVNVDSGDVFALKLILLPKKELHSIPYTSLKREVETLGALSHPNIIEFIAAQRSRTHLEIMTVLREGSIDALIEQDLFIRDSESAKTLLYQMLQALDYLAFKGIVHRDVKPANILYQSLPGGAYIFQLTDFGLCNLVANAQTYAGSPIYMAPEVYSGIHQTSKVDVWSLFVTLADALNADKFRKKQFHTHALRIKAVQEAANLYGMHPIQGMAIVDPEVRASAADMLDKVFNGEGRSTPRVQTQSAPKLTKNTLAPRKEQKNRITKNIAQSRRGRGLESPEKHLMPGAFQDDIIHFT